MGTPGAVPSTALVPATRAPTALAGLPTPGAGAPARAPAEPHGAGLGRAVRHLRFRRVLVATGAGRYGGVLLSAGTELLVLASRGSRIRFIALDHVVWIGGA